MDNKINLVIQVDNTGVRYSKNMPEILKKYFTNMEITIESMIKLTNNGEFYDVRCEFVRDNHNVMCFTFVGKEIVIKMLVPVKKETMIIKDEFCNLRNKVYHSFIKRRNVKYILKVKPTKLYTEHYKFFDNEKLVFDLSFGYNIINFEEFSRFLKEEKRLLDNDFKYKNVKKYDSFEKLNIIEFNDVYASFNKVKGLKEILNDSDSEVITNVLDNNFEENLSEIDDLMYKTGILSLDDIKKALEETSEKQEELDNK